MDTANPKQIRILLISYHQSLLLQNDVAFHPEIMKSELPCHELNIYAPAHHFNDVTPVLLLYQMLNFFLNCAVTPTFTMHPTYIPRIFFVLLTITICSSMLQPANIAILIPPISYIILYV